jgi:hypothetical protein
LERIVNRIEFGKALGNNSLSVSFLGFEGLERPKGGNELPLQALLSCNCHKLEEE